jgi:hypothetical protein
MLGWGGVTAMTLGLLWFAGTRVNIDWSSLKPPLPPALNFVRTPAPAERAGPGAVSGSVATSPGPPDTSGAARQGTDDTLVTHGKSDRALEARDSRKARASRQSIAPPVARVPPIESEIRRPGTSGETAVPRREVSTMVPRRDAPDPAPPQTVRESREDAGNDPGAIIDWLLNEGAGKER